MNPRQGGIVFGMRVDDVVKLLRVGLKVDGAGTGNGMSRQFVVFVAAISAIVHQPVGIRVIDGNVIHVAANDAEMHFGLFVCLLWGWFICLLVCFIFSRFQNIPTNRFPPPLIMDLSQRVKYTIWCVWDLLVQVKNCLGFVWVVWVVWVVWGLF